tara:strand:- start:172 stop:309 length:138 start_codon:yes stop_codon:yes gene_type:complete
LICFSHEEGTQTVRGNGDVKYKIEFFFHSKQTQKKEKMIKEGVFE